MSTTGATVFLSYKRSHAPSEELLHKIEAPLIERGYQVLIDEGMQGGDRWPPQLYEWLLGCAAAVVFASAEARDSDWCQREWHVLAARAEAAGTRVIPICVGLGRDELGPLGNLQSIDAGADTVERVMQALSGVAPWQIGSGDYLALHRAWNQYQFEKGPVLGRESFALAQVYVETECGVLKWREISHGTKAACDPFQEKHGGRVSLVGAVMQFVLDPVFRDVVVVQGPAGAGKSAFTLRLAKELESQGLHAIRIRFRDMRLSVHDHVEQMLADAVRVGPESEEQPEPQGELFDDARLRESVRIGGTQLCKWVFILDGWDEVSLAGSAGYQAQLKTWLTKIREFFKRVGLPVRVVVTGRPSAELRESGFLYPDTPILTLRPIRPEQLQWLGEQVDALASWSDLAGCRSIFSKYEERFNQGQASGVEMVGLPLLALLTFRTLSDWEGDVDALVSSPSALYSALIDQTVAHSGKGASDGLQGTVHQGGTGLRHLLRRTAAMISLFWTERISFAELQARLEECGDLQEWVNSATQGNPLHELVVNFYFKGGHPDFGCEFLHKSFREYLFAEAIVEEIERVCAAGEGPLASPPLRYWKDFDSGTVWHEASRALSRLFGSSLLTPEVRQHLFWLVEEAVRKRPQRWIFIRDLLADVYGWWAEGVHLRLQPVRERGQINWASPYIVELAKWVLPFTDSNVEPQRVATIDGYLGYALMQLTAWVHSRLRDVWQVGLPDRRYQRVDGDGRVRFCPGNGYMCQILARCGTVIMPFPRAYMLPDTWLEGEELSRAPLVSAVLTRASLHHADLSSADLLDVDLTGAQLAYADLSRVSLDFALLTGADLGAANLDYARLTHVDLLGANLSHASLDGVSLNSCSLRDADLSSASLVDSRLQGVEFRGVKLIQADLTGADLMGARIDHADLTGARLDQADLSKAVVVGADFHESSLRDVCFSAATIRESSFMGANLTGVDFSRSTIVETNFLQANLDRANLTGAKLGRVNLSEASLEGVDLSPQQLKGALGLPPEGLRAKTPLE